MTGGNVDRIVQVAHAETVSVTVESLTLLQTPEGALADRAPPPPPARPRRAAVRPRAFPDLIGRGEQLRAVEGAIADGGVVELWGPPGQGKTSLARAAAHLEPPEHGVVFCDADVAAAEDLRAHLYAAFAGDATLVPAEARLRALLADVRALVVVDDLSLERDEARRLLDLAPGCAFAVFSEEARLAGEAGSAALPGLAPEEAAALLERGLGRPLAGDEREPALRLAAACGGRPLSMVQAAAAVARGALTLAELAGGAAPARGALRAALDRLSAPEGAVLDALRAAGAARSTSRRWRPPPATRGPGSAPRSCAPTASCGGRARPTG